MTTSLAEFLAKDRKEVTVTRHGFDRYPDHQQSAEIESRALASGISASAINDVFEAYIRNEFDLNSMELWLEENKLRRPHLWPDVGTYALAAAAFSENGVLNLSARSKLVLEVGEAQADAMAKQWGLNSLQDFKTKGVRPDNADQSLAGEAAKLEAEIAQRQSQLDRVRKAMPQPEKSSNPFTRLIRDDGTRDPAIEKQIESMIRAMGTKRVADIAASANPPRRIDGTVLPAKFR